ncbi:MAG: D-alanine--D-alanine ligase [Streptococcaceae bacterium]|jgi:D-alanine-D-alanine ligase|nr:D-alanine--D-alanine ligase [Streptococcaceae bacterium]
MMKTTIVLLYGGRSAEREVSILSAFSVLNAVDYQRHVVKTYFITKQGDFIRGKIFEAAPSALSDLLSNQSFDIKDLITPSEIYESTAICFPLLHGPMGEDGTIQGFLEILKMPYVGAGVLSSAVGMDKITTKLLLDVAGIPQLNFVSLNRSELQSNLSDVLQRCEAKLTYPMFVKPANMGSSVGISKVEDEDELIEALRLAARYDSRLLVEQGVVARELEVAVLGNENIETTNPGEVIKDVDFYDYNAKYVDNQVKMQIPAKVDEAVWQKMRHYAKEAYQLLDGSGLARCDFFLDQDGNIYLNELNTMPGFTNFSMYALLWQEMGVSYAALIEKLLILAVERFEMRQSYFG